MTASQHRIALEGAFSPSIVDALDGRIREIAQEEIGFAINDLRSEVSQLVSQQERQIAAARALPPEQRREVEPAVDASTNQVRGAAQATNDLEARQRAGEQIDQQHVDQVRQQSDQAREQQVDVDRRLVSARRAQDEQDRQAASRQATGSTAMTTPVPINRGQDITDINRRLDDLELVTASTYTSVRKTTTSSNVFQQASRAAMITFLVVLGLYCLFILITPVEWDWSNALGIPAIFAGVVGAVVFMQKSGNSDNEVMTYEQARTITRAEHDQREAHLREQERAEREEQERRHDDEHSSTGGNMLTRRFHTARS